MPVEFGKTAEDYGKHRAGFPPEFFRRVGAYGVGLAGQALLDLGTGTGTLARGFARQGCHVIGLDPAEAMLKEAAALDAEAGVKVDYRVGRAEETGLPAESCDAVTAGQCWHWFDRPRAASEAVRLLRPGGLLVIAHFDWLPLPGNMVEATETLILHHNPAWKGAGGKGIYPWWFGDLTGAGLEGIESFSFDIPAPYSHEAWRGRIRASAGVGASMTPEQVENFDRELQELLTARFPEDPLQVPHRVFAVLGRRP